MDQYDEVQSELPCCCGFGDRPNKEGQDVTDGGNNIKTCVTCWCMGCDAEGVYVWQKNMLIVYNLFFWLLGCCFLALGIYSEVMRQNYSDDIEHMFLTPSVILILIGILSCIFSTLGMIGALRDNLFLLKVFVASILFFLVAELILGILAFIFKEPTKEFVNFLILNGMTTYYDDMDLKDIVDYVQKEFECCGGEIYREWEVNIYHNCSSPGPAACGVPYSCCLRENNTININSMCGYDTINLDIYVATEHVYTEGCLNAVLDFLWLNLNVLGGILLGVFVPQITGIFLGSIYLRCIGNMVEKQKDFELEKNLLVRVTPLDKENLITEEGRRISYPSYVQRPSIIADEGFETNPSFRVKPRSTQLDSDTPRSSRSNTKKIEAGVLLMQPSPTNSMAETSLTEIH